MPRATAIEDYALIGDCETAALVSRSGSVDWLCWPRLDSPSCFAALLGTPDHGRWLIAPKDQADKVERRYDGRTLILETVFESADGVVSLIDFMPPRRDMSDLVRLVVGRRGEVKMRTELVVRFDYGSIVPWVTRVDEETLRAIGGPDMVVLRTPVRLHGRDFKTVGAFTVCADETVPFVLTYGRSNEPMPRAIDPQRALRETRKFWLGWSERIPQTGKWSDALARSLITLKALTYGPSGGIAAAPTTSLPERPHGSFNWDYRVCWLRDATFTLLALMNNGYYEEARAWRDWLLRSIAGDPAAVQVMYGLTGERRLTEWEVPWLPGFGGAKPVRIGNAASTQLQLDIYGELADVLYQGHCGKLAIDEIGWQLQCKLVEHLETVWREPDQSIWEFRTEPRHYTYSKVMVWVAFDRAIRSAERFGLDGPAQHWRAVQRRVKEEVCREAYNKDLGAFVQHYGSDALDASLLLIPLVGFLPASDPRMRSTIEAIERGLVRDGLVTRFEDKVGAERGRREGAFLACSFWLADDLLLLGRRDDAVAMLERLLALRNDVGLLSEEYDVENGRMLGNFPQAFSHVALVNTIHNLAAADKPAKQRPRDEAA